MSSWRPIAKTRLSGAVLLGVLALSASTASAGLAPAPALNHQQIVTASVMPSAAWVGAEPFSTMAMTGAGLWCIGYRRRPQPGDETRRR